MSFWKREGTRRHAITAAALGTLAAGYPLSLRAAKPTAQERANVQVVKDFCASWPAHDVGKIMSYFADNGAYRPLETMETAKGRDAVEKEIRRFVNNVERFEILETWARGPMVINERIDHFKEFQIKAWHGTGVFFLKDGKIVEWFDYTTFTDPVKLTAGLVRERRAVWADLRRVRMKAVRLLEYGGQLMFNEVPTPTIARDEVLVKIKSTAVNHLDLVEASGTARQIFPLDLPWIPGHEFSGVVEEIGSDVASWGPGDAVFGTTTGMGAYAEYVAVKAVAIARKPSNLSFEEAASVPVAAQTAWEGLFTHGHLEKGQTILIHGGAGAVGAYAVQLASNAGATVTTTASGDNEAYLKSIGASRVVDYREAQFEKVLKEKVDVVFHLTAGDTQQRSFLVLKEGGHLVSATQPVSQEETALHKVSGVMMRLAPSGERLGKIGRLLEEGKLRPDVATVYALRDAARAWKDIAEKLPGVHGMSPSGPGAAGRRSHGKIVLRVASPEHEIRTRAYELYLARGAEPGRELEDWLQAERELTAE